MQSPEGSGDERDRFMPWREEICKGWEEGNVSREEESVTVGTYEGGISSMMEAKRGVLTLALA